MRCVCCLVSYAVLLFCFFKYICFITFCIMIWKCFCYYILFFIISVITLIKPSPSVLCLVVLRHLLTFAPIMTHHRTYASKYIPIIASVSEHQPPTWPSYFMDINVLAFLVPAGIIVSSGCQTHIYACVYWHSLPFLSSIVLFADMF